QIVDFWGVIREPFVRQPRRRFTFSVLEKTAVVLSVAARNPFALAAPGNLLNRIGTGGVEQPEPWSGAADIGDDQRFGYEIGEPVYCLARCVCCIDGHGLGSLDRKTAGKDAER